MVDKALHTESDLAAARAAGHAEGLKVGAEKATSEATAKLNAVVAGAVSALFPDSKRATAFCSALNKGASIEVASDVAMLVVDEAPKPAAAQPASATAAHVEQFMRSNAHEVASEGNAPQTDREKRLAEIQGGTRGYAQARGYLTR